MYMQQEKNLQTQQELNALEALIVSRNVIEHAERDRLKELAFKYPYQTFQLIKKHDVLDAQPGGSPIVQAYIVGFSLTYAYQCKLKHYLVKPPQVEQEKKEFETIIEKLEEFIQRQSKEN
jgi:hypothetical protein